MKRQDSRVTRASREKKPTGSVDAQTKTSWGSVALWYDRHLEEETDTYQRQVILPNLKRVLELKSGERLLDVACGQGFFARGVAVPGVTIVGVDISKELIARARERSPEYMFHVGSADRMHMLKDSTFDAAMMVLALQNVAKLSETLSEIHRVVTTDGRVVLVLNHPAFRIPQYADWGFDEKREVQYRRVDRYLSGGKIELLVHPGNKQSEKTISYHHALQDLYKAFHKSGLVVTRLEEWISHKKSEKGKRQRAEDTARKEIPLFLMLELRKWK